MSNRKNIIGVIGILVLVASFLIFLLISGPREAIDWTGLAFVFLAEIIFFGGISFIDQIASKTSGVFLRAGAFSILTIYGVLSVILSLVFVQFFRSDLRLLVTIQLLLLLVCMIILIVLTASSKGIDRRNLATECAVANMQALHDFAVKLERDPANQQFAAPLRRIAEAIHFSDFASVSVKDAELQEKLTALQSLLERDTAEKETLIDQHVKELLFVIDQRNRDVKSMKAGQI